jgi:tetraacyldisaccharide 4'-kinase
MTSKSEQDILGGCCIGKVLGAPYAGAMRLRRWAYRRGLKRSASAGVPVISVGNLTMGGTGKTPMVAWVVQQLKEAGRTPAILTRGYKAVAGRSDEAELLKSLTGVEVVVNPDRIAGAAAAVANGANVLMMDDGFQHMRLRRDLNIVLIDATNPFGGGSCLPCGRLREGFSALRDADAVILTRCDIADPDAVAGLRGAVTKLAPQASLHEAMHKPVKVVDDQGVQRPPESLAGRKAYVFSGIGNPDGFLATVCGLEAEPVGQLVLKDHVTYTPKFLQTMYKHADEQGAEMLLTTEKDYVKLEGMTLERPVWRLAVEMDITDGREALAERILQAAGAE